MYPTQLSNEVCLQNSHQHLISASYRTSEPFPVLLEPVAPVIYAIAAITSLKTGDLQGFYLSPFVLTIIRLTFVLAS